MSEPKRTDAETEIAHANDSFYRAFTAGSYQAMAELWAQSAAVSCVHPGAPAIVGRESVLDSWRTILREAPSLPMRCDGAVVNLLGEVAVVTCYEASGHHPAHLAATNVFVLEGGSWRMVHHHAGPLARSIPRPAPRSALN